MYFSKIFKIAGKDFILLIYIFLIKKTEERRWRLGMLIAGN